MGKYIRRLRPSSADMDVARRPVTRAATAAAAAQKRKRAAAAAAARAKMEEKLESTTHTAFDSTSAETAKSTGTTTTGKASLKWPTVEVLEEIEVFFATADQMEERKRFMDKYNFDVEKDVPLEGRYEWVRLIPEQRPVEGRN